MSYSIIGIGASAGGSESLEEIFQQLTRVNIPIVVVMHRHISSVESALNIYKKRTKIKVYEAFDKEEIKPDRIYFAPSDYHLLVDYSESRNCHIFSLSGDEPQRYAKPSIDVFFESLAYTFGRGAIGMLLSGSLDDGARGLAMIKDHGGLTIVHNPKEAKQRSMPEAAIREHTPDYILNLAEISDTVNKYGRRQSC